MTRVFLRTAFNGQVHSAQLPQISSYVQEPILPTQGTETEPNKTFL